MIVTMVQERTHNDLQYRFTCGGETLCLAIAPFERGRMLVRLQFRDSDPLQLYFNPFDTSGGESLEARMSFRVLDEGGQVGRLVGQTHRTGKLFGGYAYYRQEFYDTVFRAYEVGFGKAGLYLCIYQGDRLLGVIDKALTVANYHDTYTLYLEDERGFPAAALLGVYYDLIQFEDLAEFTFRSVKRHHVITPNKELKAKYDPTFIPRIQAMERTP